MDSKDNIYFIQIHILNRCITRCISRVQPFKSYTLRLFKTTLTKGQAQVFYHGSAQFKIFLNRDNIFSGY